MTRPGYSSAVPQRPACRTAALAAATLVATAAAAGQTTESPFADLGWSNDRFSISIQPALKLQFSVGMRVRRLQYPSVEVGPYAGETLRDHIPNLRLDGSEPVSTWSTLPATGVTEVGVVLKYRLR